MEYPVTTEKLDKVFFDTCGCKMPENQKPFWAGIVGLLNEAYGAGVLDGSRKIDEVQHMN